jgi:hypothetical protein
MRPGVYMADADGNVPAELEVIARRSAAISGPRRSPASRTALRDGTFERGGTVFTTGCTDWAYGLGAIRRSIG